MARPIKNLKKGLLHAKPVAIDKILEIERRYAKELVDDMLWLAYRTKTIERRNYLETFSGEGIAGPGQGFPDPKDEAVAQIEPLADAMECAARSIFGKVLEDIFLDPDLRDFYLRRMSSLMGKKGGRPAGKRMAHTLWLEDKLREMEINARDTIPAFSAEDHLEELRRHPDIDGENDDGSLRFHADVLEGFGWREGKEEPTVTLNSVREILTQIRKGNSP